MKRSKYILYFALLPVLTVVLFFRVIQNFENSFLSMIFGLICLGSLIITGIVFFKRFAVERVFLLFYGFFGMTYLLLLPMMIVPDEPAHWLRIFEISEGHLLSDKDDSSLGGREMPEGLSLSLDVWSEKYSDISKNYPLAISKDTQHWYRFSNTALYAPVTYIFQVPGVLIGKIFTTRTIFVMYAGRVSAFLLSLFFIFIALKHLPCCKTVLFVITMMPMFIHQSVSLSADAMLNVASLCFMVFVLWSCNTENELFEKKHVVLLCAFTLCIALSKIIYLPLVLLACLIPASKFRNRSSHRLFISLLLTCALAVNLLWFVYITTNYNYAWVENTDSAKQITNILSHPIRYAILVIKTYVYGVRWLVGTCIGALLGWLNIRVGNKALGFYVVCLLSTFFYNDELPETINKKRNLSHIIIYSLTALAIMLLIATSEYVTWTALYADNISGIQGRYFIPIVFPLCLLIVLIVKRIPATVQIKYRGKILPLKQENIFRLVLPALSLVHLLVIKQIMLFCK